MENDRLQFNRVKALRAHRGWSQDDLARNAGISRAGVSAIELNRLVPSVAAAMALATALGCSVEDLFGGARTALSEAAWAWPSQSEPCRFWHAQIGERLLLYPVEATPVGVIEHDGISKADARRVTSRVAPEETLVMASCDPAAGILAAALHRDSGVRLLVLMRPSHQALELLEQGLVHVAGLHLATSGDPEGNARAAHSRLGSNHCLLRLARWQEGVVLSPGLGVRSLSDALGANLRWVGREQGSAARQCLDELLVGRRAPRLIASSHQGVAEAVRSGWADAGVCHRVVGEEAGLSFIGVREEVYDLCFADDTGADPRLQALIRVVRSSSFRRLIGELPGFDSSEAGEVQQLV